MQLLDPPEAADDIGRNRKLPKPLGEVSSLEELFGCGDRYIERIQKYFGRDAVLNLVRNICGVSVITFYSGLGGAELSIQHTFHAACSWCHKNDEVPPEPPRCFLACDKDPVCQKVLAGHKDPMWYNWYTGMPSLFACVPLVMVSLAPIASLPHYGPHLHKSFYFGLRYSQPLVAFQAGSPTSHRARHPGLHPG